jgi:hypothetical protein
MKIMDLLKKKINDSPNKNRLLVGYNKKKNEVHNGLNHILYSEKKYRSQLFYSSHFMALYGFRYYQVPPNF